MKTWVPATSDRLQARLIDELLVVILSMPVLAPALTDVFQLGRWSMPWSSLLFLILVRIAYEWIAYAFFSATPGKWVMGLWLVDASDPRRPLGDAQIFLRILSCRLQFFFSWAPYALVFYRYDRTHLADWLAGTRVISERPRFEQPRLRWILGGCLVVVFFFAGLESSGRMLATLEWTNGWVSWENSPSGPR